MGKDVSATRRSYGRRRRVKHVDTIAIALRIDRKSEKSAVGIIADFTFTAEVGK
jgi:hypothetical protein